MYKEFDLFDEAKRSKLLLNGILAIILFVAMSFLGQILGGFVFSSIGMESMALYVGLSTASAIILCFLWVQFVEGRTISSLGLSREKAIRRFLLGLLIGLVMFSSVILIMYLVDVIKVNSSFNIGFNILIQVFFMFIAWCIQGSSEEILTRGWLMNVLGAKYSPMVGFVISSVIFGLAHFLNPNINIIAVLNIILVGFMLGLYVILTKNLWGACGLHAAWNFAQGNIYGVSVSGMDAQSTSLMSFTSTGSDILTGGAFGPEASIITSVIQIVVIIILVMRIRMKGNTSIFS